MRPAVRGLIGAAAVTALAAATVVAAQAVPGLERTPAEQHTVNVATGVPVNVCPGPQTLIVPDGADRVPSPGPVTLTAVATGPGSIGTLIPPADGAAAAPGTPRALRGVEGGVMVATSPLTTATGIRIDLSRGAASAAGTGQVASAVQTTLATSGDLRGLTATACTAPTDSAWLVGGGTTDSERDRLILSNPSSTPALLDVEVFGPRGAVRIPAGEGVVVPAGDQVALYVQALAPGLERMAVHVAVRTGRVSVSMQHSRVLGFTPGGLDEVAAAEPARTQVLPAVVVASPGSASVRVMVPGKDDAVVRIALTPVTPVGRRPGAAPAPIVATVSAGAVADVPLKDVPNGVWTATISGDEEIAASAVSTTTLPGGELAGTAAALGRTVPPTDLVWSSAVPELTGTAMVALPRVPVEGGVTATLVLAGPVRPPTGAAGAPARVVVREIGADGRLGGPLPVTLEPGTSQQVNTAPGAAGLLLQPEAGTAAPRAAVILGARDASGPMLSVVPVRSSVRSGAGALEAVADPGLALR